MNKTPDVRSVDSFVFGNWKIKRYDVVLPIKIPANDVFIGIDPGTTNLGVCTIESSYATVFQIRMTRNSNPVERIIEARKILNHIVKKGSVTNICVEGASFGDVYRQVELAEIRAACALWGIDRKAEVVIVPPSSIRKKVFGNGSINPKEIWKKYMVGDAADALACAYYLINF